jgi:uncharacterized membrane protein (DUF485 family)
LRPQNATCHFLLYALAERKEHAIVDTPTQRLLGSAEFRHLVSRRWRVSLALTVCLSLLYYGYILLIATYPALLAVRVGEVVTLAIPLGAAVILGAWLLTAIYVVWANREYDVEAERLRQLLTHVDAGQQ